MNNNSLFLQNLSFSPFHFAVMRTVLWQNNNSIRVIFAPNSTNIWHYVSNNRFPLTNDSSTIPTKGTESLPLWANQGTEHIVLGGCPLPEKIIDRKMLDERKTIVFSLQ